MNFLKNDPILKDRCPQLATEAHNPTCPPLNLRGGTHGCNLSGIFGGMYRLCLWWSFQWDARSD